GSPEKIKQDNKTGRKKDQGDQTALEGLIKREFKYIKTDVQSKYRVGFFENLGFDKPKPFIPFRIIGSGKEQSKNPGHNPGEHPKLTRLNISLAKVGKRSVGEIEIKSA